MAIQIGDKRVEVGIHEGLERGVKVVFFHNADVFPKPYPDAGPGYVVFQLTVFNKACLEYCCQKRIKPSIFITNDWFTGLMAGYRNAG